MDALGEKAVSAGTAGVLFQGAGGVPDVFRKAVSVRNVGVKSQLQGIKEMVRGVWFIHSAISECLEVRGREVRWWPEGAV